MENFHRFTVNEINHNFKRVSFGVEPNYSIGILIFVNEKLTNTCLYRPTDVSFAESMLEGLRSSGRRNSALRR
jgi:hypothetical protein